MALKIYMYPEIERPGYTPYSLVSFLVYFLYHMNKILYLQSNNFQKRSEKQWTGQSGNYGEVLITNKFVKFP